MRKYMIVIEGQGVGSKHIIEAGNTGWAKQLAKRVWVKEQEGWGGRLEKMYVTEIVDELTAEELDKHEGA